MSIRAVGTTSQRLWLPSAACWQLLLLVLCWPVAGSCKAVSPRPQPIVLTAYVDGQTPNLTGEEMNRMKRSAIASAAAALIPVLLTGGSASAAPGEGHFFTSTAFLDRNANGTHDEGEPAIVGRTYFSFEGVDDTNSVLDDAGVRTGTTISGESWGRFAPVLNSGQTQDVGAYGAFAFDFEAGPAGCTLGDVTVTVDGAPYDPAVEEQFTIQETTTPTEGEPYPTVGEGEQVFAIAEDQEALNFTLPYTCDEAGVSGVAFDDDNSNGVKDDGEQAVPGVSVLLDGLMPMGLPTTVTEEQDPAQLADWYMHDLTTDENGAYSQALLQNWAETEEGATGTEPVNYVAWVTAPDNCVVTADPSYPAGETVESLLDVQAAWVTGEGPWTIGGHEIGTDAQATPFAVAWGEDVTVDLPLNCTGDPVEEPTTTTRPAGPTTTISGSPTTRPTGSNNQNRPIGDGDVTVDTGSNGGTQAGVIAGGVAVLGAAGTALAMRRRIAN